MSKLLTTIIVLLALALVGFVLFDLLFGRKSLFTGYRRPLRRVPVLLAAERKILIPLLVLLMVVRIVGRRTDIISLWQLEPWKQLIETGWLALFVIALFAVLVIRVRWKVHARNLNYELCANCGYPLKGLPIKHVCPECGKPYDLYQTKLSWHGDLRK